ncbi:MAG TPA: two-component regulator propeller domain-containing protein, partial [Bacteroidia bacterium]|nr:two-component regulator propeller domain-containing protein [Bacteroidia bacterium]
MMRFLTKLFIVFVFSVSFSFPLFSQHSSRIHSLISGKKEVNVKVIIQDYSGYIWTGTEQGLVLYNGISYKLFQEKDGLASNNISALTISSDSSIWIGHTNGKITVYKNQNFSIFNKKDTADHAAINNILCDKNKNVWFATNASGVYKYDKKTVTKYTSENGLGDDYVYTLFEDSSGKIWMGTDA